MLKMIAASVVRHAATAAGAYLVKEGYIDADATQQAVGALITTGGLTWSFIEKKARHAF